ncbi:hypothetical protein HGM15179_002962, partial [Zosterops borbonicus]
KEIEICRRSPRFQYCGICELQAAPLIVTRYHHECCKHGQWAFLDVWVGHRSLAQGLSPLIPPSWVCLGDTVHHC